MRFWVTWTLGLALAIGTVFLFITPFNWNGKESAKGSACMSHVKQQAIALLLYADDSNDRFPPRDRWMDTLKPSRSGTEDRPQEEWTFHCPSAPKGVYGYAFNADLSGAVVPKRPEAVPLTYESANPIRNASDRFASLPLPARHRGGNNVAYADGHAKRLKAVAP